MATTSNSITLVLDSCFYDIDMLRRLSIKMPISIQHMLFFSAERTSCVATLFGDARWNQELWGAMELASLHNRETDTV